MANINYRTLLLRTAQRDGDAARCSTSSRSALERQLSTSFVASADVIGSIGRNITLLRNLNQPANGNGARPYPNFGAIQYRDHAGDVALSRRGSLARKAVQHGPQLSRVVHDRRSARQHARTSVGGVSTSAEPQRSRGLGRPGRQRHPPSICRQLHCQPAARQQPHPARLAGGRHFHGPYRPAVHRHARQPRRRRMGAQSHCRNRGTEDRRQLVQRLRLPGRAGAAPLATRAGTSCAAPAG